MKVPATPPDSFIIQPQHLRAFSARLWRIYRAAGAHSVAWNQLRHWGPVPGMRFDPQSPPAADDPDVGVLYAAADPVTALGEVFQDTRIIDRQEGAPMLVGWDPARELTLLDLTTNWPVLNGAAAAMMMDDKRHTQAWARAIHDRHGDEIDGLFHVSSITNQPIVTLFSRTERDQAFPPRPLFHAALEAPTAYAIVLHAQNELGYLTV